MPFGEEAALQGHEQVYRRMYNGRRGSIAPAAAAAVQNVEKEEGTGDNTRVLWLRFGGQSDWQNKQQDILDLLSEYPGPYDLYLYLAQEKQRLKAPERYRISKSGELVRRLEQILGTESVVWR